jgi:putative ABC transport system permease protein
MKKLHLGTLNDIFTQAIYSLRENKLRTFLSILGIAVGIGAVMLVGGVTDGVKRYIFSELKTYGLETLWVYRNWREDNPFKLSRPGSGIENNDLKTFRSCCPSVKQVSPVVYTRPPQKTLYAQGKYETVNMEGVGVNYLSINRDILSMGRGFRLEDMQRRQPIAIIGKQVSDALFGPHVNPIQKTIRWGDIRLTVVGLLEEKNRSLLNKFGIDNYEINKRVLIPYTLYQQQLGTKDIFTLQAEAIDLASTQKALDELINSLKRLHGGHYEYIGDSMDRWIDTANDVLRTISSIGLLGAAMSLLVGGLGIMNIMGTSVVERTREIGIRKALGARQADILFQFLIEAMVVSLIGGLIGLLLGIMGSYGIGLFAGYDFMAPWTTALVAIVVSLLVGIISGFYPARRAAALKPVDALRYE